MIWTSLRMFALWTVYVSQSPHADRMNGLVIKKKKKKGGTRMTEEKDRALRTSVGFMMFVAAVY